jgi:hypothetical protein
MQQSSRLLLLDCLLPQHAAATPLIMSSTAVLGFIKDITARNLKAVQDRLKQAPGAQTANQRFVDPKQEGLTYALLHKAVEVCSCEAASVLMAAAADVNAADSKGRTPLHWVAASSDGKAVAVAGGHVICC